MKRNKKKNSKDTSSQSVKQSVAKTDEQTGGNAASHSSSSEKGRRKDVFDSPDSKQTTSTQRSRECMTVDQNKGQPHQKASPSNTQRNPTSGQLFSDISERQNFSDMKRNKKVSKDMSSQSVQHSVSKTDQQSGGNAASHSSSSKKGRRKEVLDSPYSKQTTSTQKSRECMTMEQNKGQQRQEASPTSIQRNPIPTDASNAIRRSSKKKRNISQYKPQPSGSANPSSSPKVQQRTKAAVLAAEGRNASFNEFLTVVPEKRQPLRKHPAKGVEKSKKSEPASHTLSKGGDSFLKRIEAALAKNPITVNPDAISTISKLPERRQAPGKMKITRSSKPVMYTSTKVGRRTEETSFAGKRLRMEPNEFVNFEDYSNTELTADQLKLIEEEKESNEQFNNTKDFVNFEDYFNTELNSNQRRRLIKEKKESNDGDCLISNKTKKISLVFSNKKTRGMPYSYSRDEYSNNHTSASKSKSQFENEQDKKSSSFRNKNVKSVNSGSEISHSRRSRSHKKNKLVEDSEQDEDSEASNKNRKTTQCNDTSSSPTSIRSCNKTVTNESRQIPRNKKSGFSRNEFIVAGDSGNEVPSAMVRSSTHLPTWKAASSENVNKLKRKHLAMENESEDLIQWRSKHKTKLVEIDSEDSDIINQDFENEFDNEQYKKSSSFRNKNAKSAHSGGKILHSRIWRSKNNNTLVEDSESEDSGIINKNEVPSTSTRDLQNISSRSSSRDSHNTSRSSMKKRKTSEDECQGMERLSNKNVRRIGSKNEMTSNQHRKTYRCNDTSPFATSIRSSNKTVTNEEDAGHSGNEVPSAMDEDSNHPLSREAASSAKTNKSKRKQPDREDDSEDLSQGNGTVPKKLKKKRIDAIPPEPLRRSKRDRIRPLRYWIGERRKIKVVEGEIVVDGVVPGTWEDNTAKNAVAAAVQKRYEKSLSKKDKSKTKRNPPAKATVLNTNTDELVEVDFQQPFEDIDWEPVHDEKNEKVRFSTNTTFSAEKVKFGFLDMNPSELKPPHQPDANMHFVVHKGHVKVVIRNDVFEFRKLDSFIVPFNEIYSIENVGRSNALLAFSAFKSQYFQHQQDLF